MKTKNLLTKARIFILLCLFLVVASGNAFAQERTITGVVTDDTGAPLPGVTILIQGTTRGALTGYDGDYSLSGVSPDDVLVFSFVGTATQEIPVGDRAVINVTMQTEAIGLEEVVAIGYGTMQRRDITGSVSSVSGADLQRIAVPRMDQALQGQAPGVQIQNVRSNPGGDVSIRIRGQNSISGSNNPLIVIDGILGGDLRLINPQDIENIEILKDASATAIYGSRGSNGVILISTRRGQTGAPQVDINSYYGVQQIKEPLDLLNAQQHYDVLNAFPQELKDEMNLDAILAGVDRSVDTDWQSEVYRTAVQHENQVAISGGIENTNYSLSANFVNQDGVVGASGFERGSVRLNLDQGITDRFDIGLSLNLSRYTRDNPYMDAGPGSWGGGIRHSATLASPMIPVYDDEGNYHGPLVPGAQLNNAVALIHERPSLSKRNYLQGAFFANYDITSNLVFRTNVALTNIDHLGQFYAGKVLLEAAGLGNASLSTRTSQDWLFENTLTYDNTFDDIHDLSIVGGATAQGYEQFNTGISGSGFSTEVNNWNDIGQADVTNSNSSFSDERQASILGRITYSYDARYLITINGRADGSSKFSAENKWSFFPSGAVGWRISQERFMENIYPTISNLRLRASWGRVGSQAISPYQTLANFSTISHAYSYGRNLGNVGVRAGRVPNPFLRWETTEQTNIGIDIGFMENRISLTADVYEKVTKDLLYGRQLPYYSGYGSQTDNIGSIENRGLEFGLNTVYTFGELQWSANANISFNRNKVLDLGEDTEFFSGISQRVRDGIVTRVGLPMGSFYGYIFDGIYQNEAEVAAIDHPGAEPGTARYVDTNGDGVINPDDRVIIGDPNPDFIYGFTNNFRYRAFDISLFFQGVQGNDVFNLARSGPDTPGTMNSLVSSLGYWTGEGSTNELPKLGHGISGQSSNYIEDGSYLRLKNLMIGYTLPLTVLERLNLRNLRIYVSGVNLLTFTNYSGLDPEVNMHGNSSIVMNVDDDGYPTFKTYTVGLNIGF